VPGLSPPEADVLSRVGYASRLVLAVRTSGAAAEPESVVWIPGSEGGLLAGIVRAAERILLLVGRPGLPSLHPPSDERGPTQALLRGAERALPGIRRRAEEMRLYRTRRARFDVGHYRRMAKLRTEQARQFATRRIAFAGDYVVAPDLEGIVRSGFRAADDVRAGLA
jgi:hypothetical protein